MEGFARDLGPVCGGYLDAKRLEGSSSDSPRPAPYGIHDERIKIPVVLAGEDVDVLLGLGHAVDSERLWKWTARKVRVCGGLGCRWRIRHSRRIPAGSMITAIQTRLLAASRKQQ